MVNDPTSDVPLWHGQPITPGWWWLRFPDGPGPRHWDGTFWDRGGYFAGAEDYAEFPIIAPCPVPIHTALLPGSRSAHSPAPRPADSASA